MRDSRDILLSLISLRIDVGVDAITVSSHQEMLGDNTNTQQCHQSFYEVAILFLRSEYDIYCIIFTPVSTYHIRTSACYSLVKTEQWSGRTGKESGG